MTKFATSGEFLGLPSPTLLSRENVVLRNFRIFLVFPNLLRSFRISFAKFIILDRVWQLAYVAYVRTTTFIGVYMIFDMHTLTLTFIFLWFFKGFNIFLVLIFLCCLKTYCYIFDFLIYLFVLERYRFFTVHICWKPYFSIFHTSYFINISPYIREFANLGCQ